MDIGREIGTDEIVDTLTRLAALEAKMAKVLPGWPGLQCTLTRERLIELLPIVEDARVLTQLLESCVLRYIGSRQSRPVWPAPGT